MLYSMFTAPLQLPILSGGRPVEPVPRSVPGFNDRHGLGKPPTSVLAPQYCGESLPPLLTKHSLLLVSCVDSWGHWVRVLETVRMEAMQSGMKIGSVNASLLSTICRSAQVSPTDDLEAGTGAQKLTGRPGLRET